MYSPAAIENAPASRPAMPARSTNGALALGRARDAHHEREIRDEPVRDAEDDRAQRPRPPGPVPALARRDLTRTLDGVPGSGRRR